MTENMRQQLMDAQILKMFGKRKEDMTVGELLGAMSTLANLAGNEVMEKVANHALEIAIRNGDADRR